MCGIGKGGGDVAQHESSTCSSMQRARSSRSLGLRALGTLPFRGTATATGCSSSPLKILTTVIIFIISSYYQYRAQHPILMRSPALRHLKKLVESFSSDVTMQAALHVGDAGLALGEILVRLQLQPADPLLALCLAGLNHKLSIHMRTHNLTASHMHHILDGTISWLDCAYGGVLHVLFRMCDGTISWLVRAFEGLREPYMCP